MSPGFDAEQIAAVVRQFNQERLQQIDDLGNEVLATLKANCDLLSAEEVVGVLEKVKHQILSARPPVQSDD
jgi:hypothetical protein